MKLKEFIEVLQNAPIWIKAYIVALPLVLFIWIGYDSAKDTEKDIQSDIIRLVENAYATGQADALKGDIRIHNVNDSIIMFTKSPWNNADTSARWNQWQDRAINIKK